MHRSLGEIREKTRRRDQSGLFFDEAYNAHERNEITGIQYYEYVMNLLGTRMTFQEFVDGWNTIYLDVIPETADFIRKYADKTRLLGLTNSNEIHRIFWEKKYAAILNEFEKIYCSSQIRARKPAAEAYQYVLRNVGLKAGEVVFVDDTEENILGAEKVGIKSVCFVDPGASITRLESLL